MSNKKGCCYTIFLIFGILCIASFILGFILGFKGDKKNKEEQFLKVTSKHKSRVSSLQECMKLYGRKEIPDLKEVIFNSTEATSNKILTFTNLMLNGQKGETIQIYKNKILRKMNMHVYHIKIKKLSK